MNIHVDPVPASETEFRTISAKCIPRFESLRLPQYKPGPVPDLKWIEISKLIIDPTYQRALGSLAWRHIVEIATNFNWCKFAPVIVSPVEGGFFAIIDGQHRTTAAFIRQIKMVPCQSIVADRAQQAEAFAAINTKVTRLYPVNIFHAELESGDPLAKQVAEVAARAGIKIPRNKMSKRDMPGNGLNAVNALKSVVRTFGDETAITALQCITETGDGNPHMLKSILIRALAEVLSQRPFWRERGGDLLKAFDEIDFQAQIDQAAIDARTGVDTQLSALVRRLGSWLDERDEPVALLAAE